MGWRAQDPLQDNQNHKHLLPQHQPAKLTMIGK